MAAEGQKQEARTVPYRAVIFKREFWLQRRLPL